MESQKEEMKAMEVQLEKDPSRKHAFDVIIGDRFFLSVAVAGDPEGDPIVKDWVQQVHKSHRKGKKGEAVVVGISAERSRNYANALYTRYMRTPGSKDNPYDLLQLCAGNQCLLYELDPSHPIPKVLKDFVHDSRIFGVGVEAMAKELEREYGLTMRKPVELRKVAEKSKEVSLGYVDFRKKNLEQLARIVLGAEAEVARPRKIKWQMHDKYGPGAWDYDIRLSDELIKHASIDAFLACKMGTKLLKDV
ncbi:hypothetical protein ACJRO7_026137 [Eucalyptus globulus]|uniref:Uncharacterized protein n=1 Tax=Eucalyptus globulus TaxID=34317 RepID=A0ABD3KGP0_EUCGL